MRDTETVAPVAPCLQAFAPLHLEEDVVKVGLGLVELLGVPSAGVAWNTFWCQAMPAGRSLTEKPEWCNPEIGEVAG